MSYRLALLAVICACSRTETGPLPTLTVEGTGAFPLRVVALTRTLGFRHGSIPVARDALVALATQNGWQLTLTEDSAELLAPRADVVLFLLTSGDVLDAAQEQAVEAFIRQGGGFLGVHSASDTEYGWPFYQQLLATHFVSHPPGLYQATLHVEDSALAPGPATWVRTDEWYNFERNPRPDVHVVLTLDETTYDGGTLGADHPIAWTHTIDQGRAFYTALGHTDESYAEPRFLEHLSAGITWAGRRL